MGVGLACPRFRTGNQVEASTTIPDENKPAVEEALTGALISASPEAFEEQLATAPSEVQEAVVKVYDEAAIDGFQGAILVGGIVALLGALVAFWLPKQKIEPTGEGIEQIVRDTVRNTTVAKLQLEMDDLSASSGPPQA